MELKWRCSSAKNRPTAIASALRSKGLVNVAAVAAAFGGGGHECASGCAVEGPLPVAIERLLAQLRTRGYDAHVQ